MGGEIVTVIVREIIAIKEKPRVLHWNKKKCTQRVRVNPWEALT